MVPFRGPKNTHKVPSEDQIKILIDPTVLAQVDAVCPSYLSRTAFINQAVDLYLNHLTPCDTMGISETLAGSLPLSQRKKIRAEEINHPQAAKEITSNAREAKSKNQYGKKLDPEVIPEDLQHCADAIVEFWAVKKGTRSQDAATRLFNKLEAMTPDDQIKALHAATDAGWATVYEPKPDNTPQARHNHQAEPNFKHPAYKVFTSADFQ